MAKKLNGFWKWKNSGNHKWMVKIEMKISCHENGMEYFSMSHNYFELKELWEPNVFSHCEFL
jgi:hypothetical protein